MSNRSETIETIGHAATEADSRRAADSSERAYNTIRQLLVDFHLRPEERINEMQIARRLGISRTPIREALNRLASEGFVSSTPNRGFYVRSLSTEGLIDLYELRSIIECAAFRLMCKRASDQDLTRLRDYWGSLVADYANQPPDVTLAGDEGFHLLIAELSGNPEIVGQLVAINARIRFIRRIQIQHRTHQTLISAHSTIVEAAMRRDAEAGVALLSEHIEMTVSATQQALKDALLKVYSSNSGSEKPRNARSAAAR
jgi:DNA-binding GntR family transcriptional regulator